VPAGYLYHTIRFPNSWQPWGDVGAIVTNDPGNLGYGTACASIGNDLHVVGIHSSGDLYHTIRFPNSWQPWGNVSAAVQNNPRGQFGDVSCASIGDNLHVVALHNNGDLYHTIRFPNSWQPWGNVSAAVQNNPGKFSNVACASIGNDLHVVGVQYPSGDLYHTIRFPNSWQPWGNVSAAVQNNPIQPGYGFSSAHCASMINDLHLIATVESIMR
jgi:hypothetical protein